MRDVAVVLSDDAAFTRRRRNTRRLERRDQGSAASRDTPSSQADWDGETAQTRRRRLPARAPAVRRSLAGQRPTALWYRHNCLRAAEPEGLGAGEAAQPQHSVSRCGFPACDRQATCAEHSRQEHRTRMHVSHHENRSAAGTRPSNMSRLFSGCATDHASASPMTLTRPRAPAPPGSSFGL